MIIDIKVMFVSKYDFISDESGEQLKGCKVTFMDKAESNSDNSFGHKVHIINTSYEDYQRLYEKCQGKVPYDCKAEFEIVSLDKKPRFKNFIFN